MNSRFSCISWMTLTLVLCFTTSISLATPPKQRIFLLTNGCLSAVIPFKLVHNLIVVPVMLDGKKPLNFILDTGTSSPVIFNKSYLKGLDVSLGRNVTFFGAGRGKAVKGQVINNIALHLSGAATDRLGMVVLEDNPFKNLELENYTIHGVIGAPLFNSFVVEIDFQREVIKLHEHETFAPDYKFTSILLNIWSGKPVIQANVHIDHTAVDVNLMVDTGFNNSLLLYVNEYSPFPLPGTVKDKRVGVGYSGVIISKVGHIQRLRLGEKVLEEVPTIFPKTKFYKLGEADKVHSRHGTLGIDVLKNFNIIFDYASRKFYIKENDKTQPVGVYNNDHLISDVKV